MLSAKEKQIMTTKQKDSNQSRKKYKQGKKQFHKNDDSAHSRKQRKLIQKEQKKKNRKPRRRIFPIWARLIVVVFLSGIALIGGLMFGYGILGDGTPLDALKIETWQHIIDIVKKPE